LNPSIGSFDIKTFNELRPGLILWVLINISMLCEQATRRGGIANVTDSMWLVLAFQGWYVADGLYNEVCQIVSFDQYDRRATKKNSPARSVHHYGCYQRWFRFHAFRRRLGLGSLCLFSPSALLGIPPYRTRSSRHCRCYLGKCSRILHLP